MNEIKRLSVLIAVLAAGMALAVSPAFAQPSQQGYDEGTGVLGHVDEPGGAAPATDADGGEAPNSSSTNGGSADEGGAAGARDEAEGLPFTGFDVAILALVGLTLLGTGFAVRRVMHRPAES